jgi:ketol-acid reductoisomerase
MRSKEAAHSIEEVGSKLRAAMPFLDPVTVTVDGPGAAPRLAEPVGA